MKNYLKFICFVFFLSSICILETNEIQASQENVANTSNSTASVANTIANALRGDASTKPDMVTPPPPSNVNENVPASSGASEDNNQNYLNLVIRALGAALIPDNDFFAQVVTVLGVENPYPGDAQTICLARSSGNRIFQISSNKTRKPRIVKNPSELETYNYFFVKRKGEKVRYTITRNKRNPSENEDSGQQSASTPSEKTYDAIFVAKYFDNVCFVRFSVDSTTTQSSAVVTSNTVASPQNNNVP
ncbi:MAG: hypothetical protein C0432_01780 [Candidatus Puniceispirillum sp.]|nr:hypothetical protein [Candidatus Pelagibacter sp.]MBA4283005.1 hypothetical protein [Candidatus Puniceispirillum sp.]